MTKLSKALLERLGVAAVTEHANKSETTLRANIPVGDKGISFDGEIEVFKDDTESVQSLIGRVPVQVKGTQVQEFTAGNRTFPMGMDHFQNYYNSQGVIIFVVEIKRNRESKVFYKQLVPTEIHGILQEYGIKKGQGQRRIELRPISETDLASVCIKFMNETKKQPLMLIENKPFEREDYTSYEMTSLTFDPSIGNIFEHDFTLYGVKEKLTVPLDHIRIDALKTEIVETIIIDGKSYELFIETTNMEKEVILLIENSIELTYKIDSTKFDFKLKKLHSLASQLKVLPLVLDLLTGRNVEFVHLGWTFDLSVTEEEREMSQNYKRLHRTMLQLKEVFQQLDVDETTEFGDETIERNKFINQIDNFNRMMLEDDRSNFKVELPEEAKYIGFNIGGMKFILFYNPYSKPIFTNAFSQNISNKRISVICNDVETPYTPYTLFDSQSLVCSCNVNIKVIKESFNRIDPFVNDEVAYISNDFCLTCIHAFDLSQNEDFLELAEYIYSKYQGDTLTPEILYINLTQIKKRRVGELSENDIHRLFSIKQEHADDKGITFCTSVLLESKVEAKLLFGKFSEEEQERYKAFPIYKLYFDMTATVLV
ncbi:DUF4365 domain-containing protein [Bacillus cereus]|uniref:DUF4365 domain-containing protein n=1 Tax=Bacillus cereus group TaxID=86661 RepID=UPI0008728CF1|nr:DUF4365 domain-containing protein [Bacillus mycoides]OFD36307.1 hypothetical protein BWGOE1_55930 [Bacillus mycoides]OFD55278.1 hypothetical protein BWGOE6_55030 [Bacillus mycoides]